MMKWIVFIAIVLVGCRQTGNDAEANARPVNEQSADSLPLNEVAGNFSAQSSLVFDSTVLDKFLKQYPLFKPYAKDLRKFYSMRGYSYAWHTKRGLIEQSNILYNRIMQQKDNGLKPEIPYADEYNNWMEEDSRDTVPMRDVMLTGQYLHYARQVISGVVDQDLRAVEWYIPRKRTDYASILDSMLRGMKVNTRKLLYPQYYKLQAKLKHYYDIEHEGRWIQIQPDRKKYQPGDSSPVVALIRKKLFQAGDIAKDNGSAVYDEELKIGVIEFQRRFGLAEDGIIGPAVLKEMATPISKRIEKILINMERCRWIPNETNGDYLYVNIPDFKLSAVENDSVVWSSAVVVGKATNKTVIFRGAMKYVVFSPYWHVPPSIVKNEIIPALEQDPDYLYRNNMEYYEGDKIRQLPGPDNSLGQVKFLFPNSFNIYLHDTPAKSLFQRDKRAFSHGCIRVEKATELANYLLRDDPSWTSERIREAMDSGVEKFVTLKKPIPVYLLYFTAFVDDGGKLNFREDIYGRDQELQEMIFKMK